MIDEFFLERAIQIRKTYLNLNNNMDNYQKKAKIVHDNLKQTIEKITKMQEDIEKGTLKDPKIASEKVLNILSEIESEGESLNKSIDPINKQIEKLAVEEKELYRQIREKHYNLSEEQIVNVVRERLIKENLQ
jgi:Mor family transcriptional regulator